MQYTIEQTKEGTPLTRENVEALTISPTEGLCAADPSKEVSRMLARTDYIEQILTPMIKGKEINDGSTSKFDDRKMRYHAASIINGKKLVLELGATHYEAFREPFGRTRDENEAFKRRGLDRLRDPFAFFPRAPGVQGLIISSDGAVILGPRITELKPGQIDQYKGKLNGTGGHLGYEEDVDDVCLRDNVIREVAEFGIRPEDTTRIAFVGLYSDPGDSCGSDLDFAHIVWTRNNIEYFESGAWREVAAQAGEEEHSDLIALPTFDAVQKLLQRRRLPCHAKELLARDERFGGIDEWQIIYSCRAALDSLRPEDMHS